MLSLHVCWDLMDVSTEYGSLQSTIKTNCCVFHSRVRTDLVEKVALRVKFYFCSKPSFFSWVGYFLLTLLRSLCCTDYIQP